MALPGSVRTAIAVGAVFAGGSLVGSMAHSVATLDGQGTALGPARGALLREDTIARVARARTSSVVFLHTISKVAENAPEAAGQEPLFLLPQPLEPIREGLGSGVVIDKAGGILTNAHLMEGMRTVHVRTPDDDRDATLVASDPVTDLALLRVKDAAGLQPAPLGDSDRMNVGDFVVAVGNPFGLHHTVTLGIVSAKGRMLGETGVAFFQTDAAINPGSSGGPIFDLTGAVVGISTALVSGAGENVGLNFAVPINTAKEILPELYSGEVTHGWIGVGTMALKRSSARLLGLDAPGGLAVLHVNPGGPADQAGLRVADVILGAVDEPSRPAQDLLSRIRRASPGTVIRLRVWRREAMQEVSVTVGRWTPERQ